MKCPLCGSTHFFIKDEQDEFEMIPFKFENGKLCFEEDIKRDAGILETTPVFCQRCTWHDKINTLK